jgi:hypothetical protein
VSDSITIPEKPRQGDVIEWWTMQHHPGSSYVQRHRATYYTEDTCGDVLGPDYKGGRAFHDEWLIETWYAPSGSKTSGGRATTKHLQHALTIGPAGGSVHRTWEEARAAAAAKMRRQATEFQSVAARLEQEASSLEGASLPKGFR